MTDKAWADQSARNSPTAKMFPNEAPPAMRCATLPPSGRGARYTARSDGEPGAVLLRQAHPRRTAERAARQLDSASVQALGNSRGMVGVDTGPVLYDPRLHLRGDLRGGRMSDDVGHQVLTVGVGHHRLVQGMRLDEVVILGVRLVGAAHDLARHVVTVVLRQLPGRRPGGPAGRGG